MNRTTQELMDAVNTLVEFRENMIKIPKNISETKDDIDVLKAYVEYEIKKALKDILHIERL